MSDLFSQLLAEEQKQKQQVEQPEKVDTRTPERVNTRTPEQANARTPEHQNARTGEHPNTRTGERLIVRQSYNVYKDQHDALKRLEAQTSLSGKKSVYISEMVRQAIDDYLSKKG